MKQIKGRDTSPEKVVRCILRSLGCSFKLHDKNLPGKPDIVLSKQKKVVFVHGCFWHGHKKCCRSARPKTNIVFWNRKLDANIKRDESTKRKLKRMGWRVHTIWQCEIKDKDVLRKKIRTTLINSSVKAKSHHIIPIGKS